MHICTLKPFKSKMEKEELKFKRPGATNCRNHSDVIVSGVIIASPDSDVTIREREINRPVARKRFVPRKQSLIPLERSFKSSLRVCSQTFTLIALILSITISVVGGLFNIKLPERKSTIGTSSEPLIGNRFRASSILYILREFLLLLSVLMENYVLALIKECF